MATPPKRNFIPRSMGPIKQKKRPSSQRFIRVVAPIVIPAVILGASLFSIPSIIASDVHSEQQAVNSAKVPFPISVNPAKKLIVESPTADALLLKSDSANLSAAAWGAKEVFVWLSNLITSTPVYRFLAANDIEFVVLKPGYRQEEVAQVFGNVLGWNGGQRKQFLKQVQTQAPTLSEGEFVPGTYEVHGAMSPTDVQNLLAERFANQILARYTDETASQVPLRDALIIASMIERETGGTDDMRMISGIIWNRLFTNMHLQIDATLQYAKADSTKSWWPPVVPKDKYISSKYNTYAHGGLPPGPIANPSVAAVIAALNPKPTDCIFYFHDKRGQFHCSADYKMHVTKLKQYYGQGK